MIKTNKNKVEEFIRVDHAGERGAIKIYEGQLLALNTFVKDDDLKKKIEEMKIHEKEHCDYFENEIKKRNIEPTKFLPLWDILGVGLGFGSTILGKKAAISEIRQNNYPYTNQYLSESIPTTALFHPAYLLRQPTQKKTTWYDLLKIQEFLTNNIPEFQN